MRKFIFSLLLFSTISTHNIYGQEIVGGSLSPDLTKLSTNSLVQLKINDPTLTNIDWVCLTVNNNNIITVSGYVNNNNFIFTGPQGNYLILCRYSGKDGKLNSTSTNLSIGITSSVVPDKPKPTGNLFIVLVSQSNLSTDPAIPSSLKSLNPNYFFKKYLLNDILNTPYGEVASQIISTGSSAALIFVDKNGDVVYSIPYDNKTDIISTVKKFVP